MQYNGTFILAPLDMVFITTYNIVNNVTRHGFLITYLWQKIEKDTGDNMFQIVVDSAANIPAELVNKYQIQVLSFVNYVDGKELVCFDPSLSPEEEREKGKKYYDAMRAGMDVKTGLISSGDFENCFRSIMEQNEDVLYFSLSKNISGTFNSARLAELKVPLIFLLREK